MTLKWQSKKGTKECRARAEERLYYIAPIGKRFKLTVDEEEIFKGALDSCKEVAEAHLEKHPLLVGLWWEGPIELPENGMGLMHVWKAGPYEVGRVISSLEEGNSRFSCYGPGVPHYQDAKTLEDALAKVSVLVRTLNKNEAQVLAKARDMGLHSLGDREAQIRRLAGERPEKPLPPVKVPKLSPRAVSAKEKAPLKERAPRVSLGKRGYKVFGHPSLSVIHWMGAAGFTMEQAQKALHANGVTTITNDNLKYRLSAGKRPGAKPNPLSSEEEQKLREAAGFNKKGKK